MMYQKGNLKLILPYLYTLLKTLMAIYKVQKLMKREEKIKRKKREKNK